MILTVFCFEYWLIETPADNYYDIRIKVVVFDHKLDKDEQMAYYMMNRGTLIDGKCSSSFKFIKEIECPQKNINSSFK